MKKAALLFGMLLMTAPAHADITTKFSSSVQLTVDAAASQATRIGHSFTTSGNGVSTTDGTNAGVVGNAVLMTSDGFTGASSVVTASQATSGNSFSYSASYTQGDAIPTGTTVTSGVVSSLPAFGSVTTTAGGVAGSLAGTIDSAHTVSLTAGGAGTSATGQFVSEITIK